jgi:NAD(P)-dependent dehydrogenase (short-subunit alcohol dehydrogenase family)
MKDFSGKLAVVTGGGMGMGRELTRQLAAEGCSVAICDLSVEAMAETKDLALAEAKGDVTITTHEANVSVEEQLMSFAREVGQQHGTDSINLLFNNAGIAGGGSFVAGPRDEWERTFGACWFGVYYSCRTFMPMIVASTEGHIINTSSINGFWASMGPDVPHTAYCAAKFAVKGFSEALIEDLRVNAPHVGVSVVMPGHIGTEIVTNTIANQSVDTLPGLLEGAGTIVPETDDVTEMVEAFAKHFRESAPTSSAEAATIILDGVKEGRWRILVGDDAYALDADVRARPEEAYDGSMITHVNSLRGPDGV